MERSEAPRSLGAAPLAVRDSPDALASAGATLESALRATGGRRGLWAPRPGTWGALRLTTVGRRSGEPRSVIVGCSEDGANLVTMAMNGWDAPEPAWWLSLQANPHAVVGLAGGSHQEVTGRPAAGAERERLWQHRREIGRCLDAYAAPRPHETLVVVLEPCGPAE